jgi:hypothetical protein
MRECIFVLPEFDDASKFSHLWGSRLIEQVKDKVNVILLERGNATREKFEKALQEHLEADICFEDHGGEDCLCAQGGQDCVLSSDNVDKVAGKVIYTMACLSARTLGAQAYAQGCVYVGYVEAFTFTTQDEQLFCQAANSGFITYVEGETDWAKIKALMVETFNKAMEQTNDPWSQMWLQWDRDALRVYASGVDVPGTRCILRKAAIALLGPKLGWRIRRRYGLSLVCFGVGWGLMVHDFFVECADPLRFPPHGFFIGLSLVTLSFFAVTYDFVQWLKDEGSS